MYKKIFSLLCYKKIVYFHIWNIFLIKVMFIFRFKVIWFLLKRNLISLIINRNLLIKIFFSWKFVLGLSLTYSFLSLFLFFIFLVLVTKTCIFKITRGFLLAIQKCCKLPYSKVKCFFHTYSPCSVWKKISVISSALLRSLKLLK